MVADWTETIPMCSNEHPMDFPLIAWNAVVIGQTGKGLPGFAPLVTVSGVTLGQLV